LLSKTPGAANIPILGALFKSRNINHSTSELVVIVTPTLVDPLTETEEPAQPDFPIPTLNKGSFDKSLGNDKNAHPAAEPQSPEQPATSNSVPATTNTSPVTPAPTGGTKQDRAPVQTPEQSPITTPANSVTVSGALAEPGPTVRSMVQIMTLSNSEDAASMVAALKRQGYNVAVNHDPLDSLLHLEVGPFASKSDAEAMRHRLVIDGYDAVVR
jgi:cell division septation protein DedD